MGWDEDVKQSPTGYWLCWQEGLRGMPPRFKANSEADARRQYLRKYGYEPDYCEQEMKTAGWGGGWGA